MIQNNSQNELAAFDVLIEEIENALRSMNKAGLGRTQTADGPDSARSLPDRLSYYSAGFFARGGYHATIWGSQQYTLLTDTEQVASTLAEIGGKLVNTQMMHLLAYEQLDAHMRRRIAEALETLGADEEAVQALAPLLYASDMADTIHRTLWTESCQLGLRIFVTAGPTRKRVEVVKFP